MRNALAWLVLIAVCGYIAKVLLAVFVLLGGGRSSGTDFATAPAGRERRQADAVWPADERTRATPEAQPADDEGEPPAAGLAADDATESSPSTHEAAASDQPPATKGPPASTILKCRDASGAISFTQGYCPHGTSQVPYRPAN